MCGCSFVTVAVVVMLGVTTVLITSLILVSRVATFRDQSVAVQGNEMRMIKNLADNVTFIV